MRIINLAHLVLLNSEFCADIDSALLKIDEVASNQEGIAAEEALILRGYAHLRVAVMTFSFTCRIISAHNLGNLTSTKMSSKGLMPVSRSSSWIVISGIQCVFSLYICA